MTASFSTLCLINFRLLQLLVIIVHLMVVCSTSSLQSISKYSKIPLIELLSNIPNKPLKNELSLQKSSLRNQYYGLRHGQSSSNLLGRISSDPSYGSLHHGLTETGKIQAQKSAAQLIDLIGKDNILSPNTIFVSSNFTRARETTEECIQSLSSLLLPTTNSKSTTAPPSMKYKIKLELNERYFGSYDDADLLYYNRVWPIDQLDSTNEIMGVESIEKVVIRLLKFINYYESNYKKTNVICTSHADTLQIFNMLLSGLDVRNYSQYRFNNGEVRNLALTPPLNPVTYD